MTIESLAYGSPFRTIDTGAKLMLLVLATGGVYLSPAVGGGLSLLIFPLLTVAGGKTPLRRYLSIVLTLTGILAVGTLPLLVSLRFTPFPAVTVDPDGWTRALPVFMRSLGTLLPLLFLSLTTPMTDLVSFLRGIGTPAPLTEVMTVGYRMISVLAASLHEVRMAQVARLGYSSRTRGVRSARMAAAGVFVRLFVRSRELSRAAEARGVTEELRGLPPRFPHPLRDRFGALALGSVLLLGSLVARWG